jgi:serine/threonine protein phosphatase PrpC
MTIVSLNRENPVASGLGVGNVQAILLRNTPAPASRRRAFSNRGGVVGYRLPPLRIQSFPVQRGDLLILATDGIRTGFSYALTLTGSPQKIADQICSEYGKETDDALAVVVRYLGPQA